MKKNDTVLGLSTSLLTNNALKSNMSTPAWLEIASKQQRILDPITVMAAQSLKTSIAALPSQSLFLNGCISGLESLKHAIDTVNFNPLVHIPDWQKNISSTVSLISASMPNLTKLIDLPRLNAFESETVTALKSAGISAKMTISSLQISETLQSFAGLSADILPKVDMALASSQLLINYSSLVEKQYSHIQKNIANSPKYLKVIELATKVVQDQIVNTGAYFTSEQFDTDDVFTEEDENNSKTIIQYIPVYLGYALRDDSLYDLEEEYAKSAMGQITEGGKNIVSKIQYINELRMAKGKDYMFKPTNKTYTVVSCLMSSFATDQYTFGNVMDSLYMLIYEGSGSAKRVLEVLTDKECSPLWDIKFLRTDCRHDVEHGSESDIKNKKRKIGEAYKTICGKLRPFMQKEWVSAHCNLFVRVNEFLDLIIDRLSVTEEGEM